MANMRARAADLPTWTGSVDTIDDVIARLTQIVDWAKANQLRVGYFPALYRKVTVEVKRGIEEGRFDDGPRMERLDVVFAKRYLDAFDAYMEGGAPTRAWVLAFDTTEQWWPIVLQHLLLGMNAHINLDLGIAAARSVPSGELHRLKGDFDRINEVLASLVQSVQEELAEVWTVLGLLNRYLDGAEDAIINFSMKKARDHAWDVATRLSPLSDAEQSRTIQELDGGVVKLGRLVRHPGIVGGTTSRLIRLGERGSVGRIVEILE